MMVFALAACGDNNTTDPDKDSPGVSQSGENNNGGASLSTVIARLGNAGVILVGIGGVVISASGKGEYHHCRKQDC